VVVSARARINRMGMIADQITDATHLTEFAMTRRIKDRTGRIHAAAYASLLLTLVWPVLGCNSNSLLIPDPSVRYLAFGDSATSGDSGRGYPEILSELLGSSSGTIANQGSGGETTGKGLDRLRQLLSLRVYPNAEALLYWEGGVDIIDFMRQVDGLLLFSPQASDYPYSTRLTETLDQVQANIETAISEGQSAGLTVFVAT
jgi:hypothetical protein